MLYSAIFVTLYVIGWLICAFIPWLALSVATRGHAGLGILPLCLFAGVIAALAVPVFGLTGATGFWLSFVIAALVPAALLALRRFSLHDAPLGEPSPRSQPIARTQEGPRPK